MDLLPNKSLLPILSLDVELFQRNNVSIAFLVIISGLIKNVKQRQDIIGQVKPIYINVPFNRYLYEIVIDELNEKGEIDITPILSRIPDFELKFYGTPSDERSLRSKYFTFAQVLNFEPTPEQVSKAISMVVAYARKRGVME